MTAQDDNARAQEKSLQLLKTILPENTWTELEKNGLIRLTGKHSRYVILPSSQTEIYDLDSGRFVAYACIQLSISAPAYDRVIAEYLLIKNAENIYLKTAKIFKKSGEFEIAMPFFVAIDIVLFMNLLLTIATTAR